MCPGLLGKGQCQFKASFVHKIILEEKEGVSEPPPKQTGEQVLVGLKKQKRTVKVKKSFAVQWKRTS